MGRAVAAAITPQERKNRAKRARKQIAEGRGPKRAVKGYRFTEEEHKTHTALFRDPAYRKKLRVARARQPNKIFRKPNQVRNMSKTERAWMGALFEGEGYMSFTSLQIGSTEIETVATCLRLTGAGSIWTQKPHKGRKRMWVWYLGRINSVFGFLRQVRPYLTGKRTRVNRYLKNPERAISYDRKRRRRVRSS